MELAISFFGFIFISTITPGPNNLLLAASGIRFGVRRTLPHIAGIHLGVYLLIALCGLGMGQLLLATPYAVVALKVFGSGYLIYLAWKIIGFELDSSDGTSTDQPMNLLQAAIFQFSNPKAWMMATTGLNISFAWNNNMASAVVLLCLGFATLGILCNLTWVWLGSSLSRLFTNPTYRLIINATLAIVTVATVIMFWFI